MARSICSGVGVFQDGIEVLQRVEEWCDERGECAFEDRELVAEFLFWVVVVGVSGVVGSVDEPSGDDEPLLQDGGQRIA